MANNETVRRGILLMNLGSPDSTDVPDVKRYLDEFLMDDKVIDYPYLLRLLLIKGLITPKRAPRSAEAYKKIWWPEGSPLIVLTERLKSVLARQIPEPVEVAMRYGNPSVASAFQKLMDREAQLDEVLAFPLYPHYAMSSYETAVDYTREIYKKGRYPFRLSFIRPFYREPGYINALAESIRPYLTEEFDYLLFSYHGLPERHIRKADPTHHHCLRQADCCTLDSTAHRTCYRHQIITTMELTARQLGLPSGKYGFSFQSRLGRESWLKPYSVQVLEELPKKGVKKLLVVCPAFVADCLETLEEMAMEGRDTFMNSGGESFQFIPCMNTQPAWVDQLTTWVSEYRQGDTGMLLTE